MNRSKVWHAVRRWVRGLAVGALAAGALQAAGVTSVGVPGRANANVSMAASGTFTVAVWSAATEAGPADIYASVSRDAGTTFSAPVRVNSVVGDVRVNGEQPPRVALRDRPGRTPEIGVVWTAKGTAGTRLATSVSTDGGATFGASAVVPGTDTVGNRGWEGLGVGPGGRFFAVWLDHRKLAQQETRVAGQHQHTPGAPMPSSAAASDGVAMAQLSQLYVASVDGSSPAVAVTGGVCYCCKTAIASGEANALYVAWRHVYPGNMRDIAFAASRDGGKTFSAPVRVSEDKWQIEGCPDDGPSMAVDRAGRIHVVWPSVVTENGGPLKALFHAVSTDGRRFSVRDRLPTQGQANHPQLVLDGANRLVVVWDESGSGTRRLAGAIGSMDAGGRVTFQRNTMFSGSGTYPVVVPLTSGGLAAWTAGDPSRSLIQFGPIGS